MLRLDPPAEQQVIDVDGTSISVLVAGKPGGRPPVLALHGFGSSGHYTWQSTGHLVALAKADRFVIAPDLPGHGRSDKPTDPSAYSLAGYARQAVAVLDAVAGSGPADVLGYSLGGRVSWELLTDGTGRWRRAVLGGFDGRPLFAGVDEPALRAALGETAGSDGAHTSADGDTPADSDTPAADPSPTAIDQLPPATRRIIDIARAVRGNSLPALLAVVTALSGSPAASGDPRIPLLLAAGSEDPLADRAEDLAAGIPTAEFLTIPRRNHISAVPAGAFRHAVVDFLAGD